MQENCTENIALPEAGVKDYHGGRFSSFCDVNESSLKLLILIRSVAYKTEMV